MSKMLPKAYDPKGTEDRIYEMWESSGAFTADRDSGKETFTISMPPPNATGTLHLGHAVMLALEDIFIRYNRMQGKEALWVPGTDHASIATESVVIKKIQEEEGIKDPRETLGREELLKRIREFVANSQDRIRTQVRKMGTSCDWSRESYTMEPALARTTYEAFVDMYEQGVIYRGHRSVNWDPKLQTTLSDDEVDYKEQKDPFYWFKYGPFEIGTVRPETKFGDKYVVMHPDDERYKDYKHGDTFECEWINGKITATVIKDEAADPEMGSGCMTITPWHSTVDFEIAQRHNLEFEQIIDFEGKLMDCAGDFAGMHISEARPKLIEHLDKKGLIVKVDEDYVHNVAVSSRGGGIVEPQIKQQWFVDVNKQVLDWKGQKLSIKEVMQDTVRSGMIKIIPERFEKVYFSWIDNLRDWCISRQIWWGHRIPAWYKGSETYVGVQPPEGEGWEQDSDTLDTWYGVAQWTWSPLIDAKLTDDYSLSLKDLIEQSPDLKHFHPTQVMETGYDIIFFWVARMILMTTYCFSRMEIGESEKDRIPFETVYLHGLIRTRDGKKMSKSDPSTMIDPLDIIPNYGADALRLSMIVGQTPGNDSKLYEEKIAGYRNFINKLWNASRFVLMQCEDAGEDPHQLSLDGAKDLSLADRALLSGLQDLIDDVSSGLEAYRLSEVGERLYSFTWDFFCDWYLELSKGDPSSSDGLRRAGANHAVLVHALRTILQLLHPYCPFVTEELWEQFKPEGEVMLLKHAWPTADDSLRDKDASKQLQLVIDAISAIRKLRSDQGIEPGKKVNVILYSSEWKEVLESESDHIQRMTKLESLTIETEKKQYENAASAHLDGVDVFLPLEGLIDIEAEKKKLTAEKEKLAGFIAGIEKKLSKAQFTDNAPENVIAMEREKLESNQQKLATIEERLASLS